MTLGGENLPRSSNNASAHRLYGNVLRGLGRIEDALLRFRQAIAIDPNSAATHIDLAYTLYEFGRSEEAIAHYKRAIALEPDNAAAHSGLGIVLVAVGRTDEARQAFDAAINLAPNDPNIFFHLGRAIRFSRDDRYLPLMKRLLDDAHTMPSEAQIYLHLAIAKAFADIGDEAQSFHHLLKGKALKRQQTPYDEAGTLNWLTRVQRVFSPALMREKTGQGNSSDVPVFIVGMHRSGTTLVEQILASHPRCFGAGELENMGRLVKDLKGPDRSEFPETVPFLSGDRLNELGARYLSGVRRFSATADRITDKMPINFVYVGLIHLMFPNARIVHTVRDPRDTALSCFSTLFAHGLDYSCDLAELGRFYRGYRSLMAHWRNVLPPDAMLEVKYETLVNNFEEQARRIVSHCGLEWDEACTSFYRTERAVLTPSVGQVRRPIYQSSVERWRRYETFLQPFIKELADDETA
jgi:lipoprotein NlpI